jgi:hypothetical protein
MSERASASWREHAFRDWLPAAVFIAVGVFAIMVGRGYEIGTAFQMGPGFLPITMGVLLVLFGGAVLALGGRDVAEDGEEAGEAKRPIPIGHTLRVLACILGSYLVFALAFDQLGLLVSTALLVVVAALARPDVKLGETAILAIGLAVICSVVFVRLLGVNAPIFPS